MQWRGSRIGYGSRPEKCPARVPLGRWNRKGVPYVSNIRKFGPLFNGLMVLMAVFCMVFAFFARFWSGFRAGLAKWAWFGRRYAGVVPGLERRLQVLRQERVSTDPQRAYRASVSEPRGNRQQLAGGGISH